jgi:hypothetical protein
MEGCICQVASRSGTSQSQLDCKMLQQRLLYNSSKRRVPVPMLLVDGCVLHITTFGRKVELQIMDRIKDSYTAWAELACIWVYKCILIIILFYLNGGKRFVSIY